MKQYRVLTINPGSTSTKIALFEGETCLFSKNVAHDAQELAKFKTIPDARRPFWTCLPRKMWICLRWTYLSAAAAVCLPWRVEHTP